LTHYLETRALEQPGKTFAHQNLIVGYDDAGAAGAHSSDYGCRDTI
jgi:hypothetical protein